MGLLPRQANGRVRSEVLWRIERPHIEQAIADLDAGVEHGFDPSTDYDLIVQGRRYAPKAVLGVAAQHALGQQLVPGDFSAGSTCFNVLIDRGFVIAPKSHGVPRTWIFQGDPDRFDIDGYLTAGLERITWTVAQHRHEIRPGDKAFLWRASGDGNAIEGIVAHAIVDSDPWDGPEHEEAIPFWRNDPKGAEETTRVWLRVTRVAGSREVVKRDWLKEDAVCGDLLILRQRQGTNYRVPPKQVQRLHRVSGVASGSIGRPRKARLPCGPTTRLGTRTSHASQARRLRR